MNKFDTILAYIGMLAFAVILIGSICLVFTPFNPKYTLGIPSLTFNVVFFYLGIKYFFKLRK